MIREKLKRVLDSPVAGLSPWIVMSLVSGSNGRFELSVGLALALSVLLVVLNLSIAPEASLKALDLIDSFFFAGLAVIGLLASAETTHWLRQWAGEISNLVLVLIAVVSLAIRRPFTLTYARETVDSELWARPSFVHTNYVVTWVWTVAFSVQAASGAFGDAVLDNPDNLWTAWIVQAAAIVVAVQLSAWYTARVRAQIRRREGLSNDPLPPGRDLVLPLGGWLVPVGVIALVVGGSPWWLGVGLVVGGCVLSAALRHDRSRGTTT